MVKKEERSSLRHGQFQEKHEQLARLPSNHAHDNLKSGRAHSSMSGHSRRSVQLEPEDLPDFPEHHHEPSAAQKAFAKRIHEQDKHKHDHVDGLHSPKAKGRSSPSPSGRPGQSPTASTGKTISPAMERLLADAVTYKITDKKGALNIRKKVLSGEKDESFYEELWGPKVAKAKHAASGAPATAFGGGGGGGGESSRGSGNAMQAMRARTSMSKRAPPGPSWKDQKFGAPVKPRGNNPHVPTVGLPKGMSRNQHTTMGQQQAPLGSGLIPVAKTERDEMGIKIDPNASSYDDEYEEYYEQYGAETPPESPSGRFSASSMVVQADAFAQSGIVFPKEDGATQVTFQVISLRKSALQSKEDLEDARPPSPLPSPVYQTLRPISPLGQFDVHNSGDHKHNGGGDAWIGEYSYMDATAARAAMRSKRKEGVLHTLSTGAQY